MVTYLSTTTFDGASLNGLDPSQEQASLDLFQAASMAEILEEPTPLDDAAIKLRADFMAVKRRLLPDLKDEL